MTFTWNISDLIASEAYTPSLWQNLSMKHGWKKITSFGEHLLTCCNSPKQFAMDFRNCTIMHGFLLSDTHIEFLSSETAILSQNRTVRPDSAPVCLTGRLSSHQREFRRRGTQCSKTLWPLVWEGTACYWDDTLLYCWMSRELYTPTHKIWMMSLLLEFMALVWLAGPLGQNHGGYESLHFYCGSL